MTLPIKLTALHFEIVRVLAGNPCGMPGLEDRCEEWTTPTQLQQAVEALVAARIVEGVRIGWGEGLTPCAVYGVVSNRPAPGQVVRVREGVRSRPGGPFRKCCGRVGIVEEVNGPNLTLRFGPRKHEYVVLPIDHVEAL